MMDDFCPWTGQGVRWIKVGTAEIRLLLGYVELSLGECIHGHPTGSKQMRLGDGGRDETLACAKEYSVVTGATYLCR
jgi:hypothetical protein